MQRLLWLAVPLFAAALAGAGLASGPDPFFGVWRNPKGSVHIELAACGERLCGTVVWASDKAVADAREGGTDPLVGTVMLRDFEWDGKGKWRGKVFVPDIRRSFSGTLKQVDDDTLKGRGCILVGLICKSQTWTRVAPASI